MYPYTYTLAASSSLAGHSIPLQLKPDGRHCQARPCTAALRGRIRVKKKRGAAYLDLLQYLIFLGFYMAGLHLYISFLSFL